MKKHTLKFSYGIWYLDGVAYNNLTAALCQIINA